MRKTRARAYPTADRIAARTKKISVTVAEDVLHDVRDIVRRDGGTLSGYVTGALAREVRLRRLKELLDEDEAEHGPIAEEELRKVREKWPG